MGIGVAIASVAYTASLIEKHVTLRRADGGVDAAFSLEPSELAALVRETRAAWDARGTDALGPSDDERPSLVFRRSLYICADLEAGDELTPQNLRAIRPGLGLPPKCLKDLLGRRVSRAIKRGTPASWSFIA